MVLALDASVSGRARPAAAWRMSAWRPSSRSAPRSAGAPSCSALSRPPARGAPHGVRRVRVQAALDPESLMIINHSFADVSEKDSCSEYERFHEARPTSLSDHRWRIDAQGTGGHVPDRPRGRAATAERSCARTWPRRARCSGRAASWPSGASPRRTTQVSPSPCGSSYLVSGSVAPLCHRVQFYGTWDTTPSPRRQRVSTTSGRARPDLGKDIHALAGWAVRRIFRAPSPFGERRLPGADPGPGRRCREPRARSRPPPNPAARRMEAASRARSRDRAVRSSPSSPSTSAAC